MFLSVSHLVDPNASDPSLIPFGTAFNPSSVATITTGTVKRAKVKEAHKIPPVPKAVSYTHLTLPTNREV